MSNEDIKLECFQLFADGEDAMCAFMAGLIDDLAVWQEVDDLLKAVGKAANLPL